MSTTFDCYFHLWNNGTAHCEREKRLWEIEQEKEWNKVLSKSSKRKAAKSQKKVSFAQNLILSPKKHVPQKTPTINLGLFQY